MRRSIFVTGSKFGLDLTVQDTIIVWELYGLIPLSEYLHLNMYERMRYMGFEPCMDGPDTWMKPSLMYIVYKYY